MKNKMEVEMKKAVSILLLLCSMICIILAGCLESGETYVVKQVVIYWFIFIVCSAEYFVVLLNTAFGKNENVVFYLSTKYDIILGAEHQTSTEPNNKTSRIFAVCCGKYSTGFAASQQNK